jgi:hypothetical protein
MGWEGAGGEYADTHESDCVRAAGEGEGEKRASEMLPAEEASPVVVGAVRGDEKGINIYRVQCVGLTSEVCVCVGVPYALHGPRRRVVGGGGPRIGYGGLREVSEAAHARVVDARGGDLCAALRARGEVVEHADAVAGDRARG